MKGIEETTMSGPLDEKYLKLLHYFKNNVVVVGYSGGVDSSVIAEIAFRSSTRMVALTASSITVLPGEVEAASDLANTRGWEHRVVQINELDDDNFSSNPTNRCYYCKSGLSLLMHTIGKEIGANLLVDGTNVSEIRGHRPGAAALKENSIVSPYLLFDVNKEEIRQIARLLGLPNSEKPGLACLSSRFPYGVRITPEKLRRVGLAERYIIDTYGVRTLRVRDHEGLARIEVAPEERSKLVNVTVLDDLDRKLKSFGFQYVAIDCLGYRSGSLNEGRARPEGIELEVESLQIPSS